MGIRKGSKKWNVAAKERKNRNKKQSGDEKGEERSQDNGLGKREEK